MRRSDWLAREPGAQLAAFARQCAIRARPARNHAPAGHDPAKPGSSSALGHLMGVVRGRQTGPDVQELADAGATFDCGHSMAVTVTAEAFEIFSDPGWGYGGFKTPRPLPVP